MPQVRSPFDYLVVNDPALNIITPLQITTLLFDCDNTLVLSEELAFEACAELANEILAVSLSFTFHPLLRIPFLHLPSYTQSYDPLFHCRRKIAILIHILLPRNAASPTATPDPNFSMISLGKTFAACSPPLKQNTTMR